MLVATPAANMFLSALPMTSVDAASSLFVRIAGVASRTRFVIVEAMLTNPPPPFLERDEVRAAWRVPTTCLLLGILWDTAEVVMSNCNKQPLKDLNYKEPRNMIVFFPLQKGFYVRARLLVGSVNF